MAEQPEPAPEVERFHATSGTWLGWTGVGCLLGCAVLVLWSSTSLGSVAAAIGLCWGALVVWLALLRPTLRAHPDHLLLRNILRDTEVPWHLVDDVAVRHTLRVYVDEEVHHGVAVSRSTRQMLRQGRPDSPRSVLNVLGNRSMESFANSPDAVRHLPVVDGLPRLRGDPADGAGGQARRAVPAARGRDPALVVVLTAALVVLTVLTVGLIVLAVG